MKAAFLLIVLFFLCLNFNCIAQFNTQVDGKPSIDSTAYLNWRSVERPTISDDGRYVAYYIRNGLGGKIDLEIELSMGNWKIEIENVRYMLFTDDSKFAIVMKTNDSVDVVLLGNSIKESFSNVRSIGLWKDRGAEFLIFSKEKMLGIYDMHRLKATYFHSVSRFYLSKNKKTLLILEEKRIDNRGYQQLNKIESSGKKAVNVWTGEGLGGDLVMDIDGSQIAFLVTDTVKYKAFVSCLYTKNESKKPRILFTDESVGLKGGASIYSLSHFSEDGSVLYFQAKKKPEAKSEVERLSDVHVNIWSYQDKKIPLVHSLLNENDAVTYYAFVFTSKQVNCLTTYLDVDIGRAKNNIWLLRSIDPDVDLFESTWNNKAMIRYSLVDIYSGKRTAIKNIARNMVCYLSPGGKFVIISDLKDFYSYNIDTGEYINLTMGIDVDWSRYCFSDRATGNRKVAGWLQNDEGVLLYDRYDLWLLDPMGRRRPINITNGYGKKHQVIFSLGLSEYMDRPISRKEKLILSGTSLLTKENGFFEKYLVKRGNPRVLTFGPYVFEMSDISYVSRAGIMPIKARKRNKYIISRMNASTSLNLYLTSDFVKMIPLSNNYPERHYNWYTTELHTWESFDGTKLQGVLYKPGNFDIKRKYPLILTYYEKKSFDLNVCLIPSYSDANLDIPTYVSSGYLVFAPDIDYKMGDPMQGTYNSVVSAAQYLSRMPFVDSSKMGIQGFSYGGLQTYYLISHTSMFAAACAGAGITNMVSAFGTVTMRGGLQAKFEYGGQYRMNCAPWEFAEKYIKNSPIFEVNKVFTPLLIIHTTNDNSVPFSQAIEFFTALRRLGRKTWMLEYTDGDHIAKGKSAIDFDIRLRQFFAHYLMGKPAPKWMIYSGLDLENKIKEGLQLDYKSQSPGKSNLVNDDL